MSTTTLSTAPALGPTPESLDPQIPSLVDPALDEAVRTDGYAIVDLATPEMIESLLDAYRELDSGIDTGFYPSLMSADEDYKVATHFRVHDLLWPSFSALLNRYEPLLGVFMVKHPGPETEVAPHQDWVVADESLRPTINVWLPLTPLNEETGLMHVLPGSHRWLQGLRGSPTFPTQWETIHERVFEELMTPIEIKPGQAMIYDIRMLHGTPPNCSSATRVAASLYGIPEGAAQLHYYRAPDGTVHGYEVARHFCTSFQIGDVPNGTHFCEIPDYELEPLTFEEFERRHRDQQG